MTQERTVTPSQTEAMVKICSIAESSFGKTRRGLAHAQKNRVAAGSLSHDADSPAAEVCTVGVISPAEAVLWGTPSPSFSNKCTKALPKRQAKNLSGPPPPSLRAHFLTYPKILAT